MIFYLALGGLFTVYGLDLLALVVISAIARACEITAAIRKKKESTRGNNSLSKVSVHSDYQPEEPAVTLAFGNVKIPNTQSISKNDLPKLPIPAALHKDALLQQADAVASPPPASPTAPPCPEPHQSLRPTISNASSYSGFLYLQDGTNKSEVATPRSELSFAEPGSPSVQALASYWVAQHDQLAEFEPSAPPVPTISAVHGEVVVVGAAQYTDTPSVEHAIIVMPEIHPLMPEETAHALNHDMPVGKMQMSMPEITSLDERPKTAPPECGQHIEGANEAAQYPSPVCSVMRLTEAPSGLTMQSLSMTSAEPSSFTEDSYSNPAAKPIACDVDKGPMISALKMASSTSSILPYGNDNGMCTGTAATLQAPGHGKVCRKATYDYKLGVSQEEVAGDIVTWPLPIKEYPLVLIQVPMYNEEAHGALIVERCCAIAWPRSRLLIQVLDDSTKAHIRAKVDNAAVACMEKGHPVQVLRRTNRQGFKAGAMSEGLAHATPLGYKYVAIFDADFEPPWDFLLETIGPLESDDKLGFVQTRWLNPSKSFLTWAQKVNLGFHFDVEQRARSFMGWFFNFNGTAGVWRIQAIDTSGGWESDTVVEDMDLSLRAYLAGWRGLYLPHVGCTNEVPDDLSTYKTQQYRWLCGPMQILCKAYLTIWNAKKVPFSLRLNCYWFFTRYILFALITLAVLVVPPVAMWLDPWHWHWPEIFFCVSVNFALAVYLYITPFSVFYLLFSVAIGYFKAWAMLGGLFGSKKSKSWKVTAKKGASDDQDAGFFRKVKDTILNLGWPYALESALSVYYGALAGLAFASVGLPGPSWLMGAYCAGMSFIFLVLSFGDAYL